jgi:hypothetical protein
MVKLVPEDEATLEPGEDILELEYILYTLDSLDILIYESEFPNYFLKQGNYISGVYLTFRTSVYFADRRRCL